MSTTLIPPDVPVTPSQRREAQRMQALAAANRVKDGRAALLRRMGELDAVPSVEMAIEIVQDPPELLAGITVERLLERVRRFGPTKARKVRQAAELEDRTTLAALSGQERVRLVTALQMRAAITKAG